MPTHLRAGTRGSPLALWQTERIRGILQSRGTTTDRTEIKTTGDIILDVPLSRIGSRALFTKELDEALLDGRVDFAVHSLKDLPTVMPDGIALAAVGLREDPRDALVAKPGLTWQTLPSGAMVATSSLRRRAQLLAARPDLRIVDVRGNLDTRLAKLDRSDEWSAMMLAAAGLSRLGLGERITERLPQTLLLPAPGQGALGITIRADDHRTRSVVHAAVHETDAGRATTAERAFLRRLEGGCQVPIAAHAVTEGDRVALTGRVASLDGRQVIEGRLASVARDDAEAADIGTQLAEQLLAQGAGEVLAAVRAAADGTPPA